MAGLKNSLTVQDTTNSYGCLAGANPAGKIKYKLKSKVNPRRTKKEKIVDSVKMIKIMGTPIVAKNLNKVVF